MSTQVQWLTPPPLWQEFSTLADNTPFRSPAILRFATDTFMKDLQSVLANAPQTLRNYVAQGETWRYPGAGVGYSYTGPSPNPPLKLYQPTHGRFYLIASSLACRKPGLPDHTVNKSAGEAVTFVVRQLRPINSSVTARPSTGLAGYAEYAWIPASGGAAVTATAPTGSGVASTGASNASPSAAGWVPASGPDPVAGEEQLPLTLTQTGSNGTSRRIYIGLIPASRRQQYVGGQTLSASTAGSGPSGTTSGTPSDPRMDLFNRTVVAPWHNLHDWWNHRDSPPANPTADETTSSDIASALILYDFSTFLSQYLTDVWNVIAGTASTGSLTGPELSLYNTLGPGLCQALQNANQFAQQLENIGFSDALPNGYTAYALTDSANWIKPHSLVAPVANALPALSTVSVPAIPPVSQSPSDAAGNYWFIVRCVYQKPQCKCNVVSPPCQPFQLASYFDSDAPARRIQVALPIDTSPAALRKYDKGVAFTLSAELRNQMARAQSLSDLSSGNLSPAGGLSVGWICSFSIPIITICALILLFVIVITLNLVFFWIPFFKICFPVPELEGS
jgi:hypothetical protein